MIKTVWGKALEEKGFGVNKRIRLCDDRPGSVSVVRLTVGDKSYGKEHKERCNYSELWPITNQLCVEIKRGMKYNIIGLLRFQKKEASYE